VIVSDFIDLTRQRINTFFDDSIVAHVAMADPICPALARAATEAANSLSAPVHPRGTYLCIEGPQFSTRAESLLYRSWGVDVIGMTAMPEAKLAREAELPYATLAFVTDYDCWNEVHAEVSVEVVLTTLKQNADLAPRIVAELVPRLPDPRTSPAFGALKSAIITDCQDLSPETLKRVEWLIRPSPTNIQG
jgi:5'-methylthioadenosine phosphorylase